MRVVHAGWSSERSVSAAAEPPHGPPRPHGSARPPGRLARAALWCAEPRLTPGSSATQDHHTRVPRAVSACRCAPRELNEHAEPIGALPRPTTARRIASSSTPPRAAAPAEAIAAGARMRREHAMHLHRVAPGSSKLTGNAGDFPQLPGVQAPPPPGPGTTTSARRLAALHRAARVLTYLLPCTKRLVTLRCKPK